RRDMLTGQIPASCSKCFKEEAAGHRSKRNWETDYWSQRVDVEKLLDETQPDGSVPPKLYYVDLRLGTKCNLKCVMCSPHDSSMWVPDWNQLFPKIQNKELKQVMVWDNKGRVDGASYNWHKDNELFWKQLYDQIPHMHQLYFAGGESTIIPEHYSLLEECIKRGEAHHIELRYNSNGIELPPKLFELWKHFKRVRFHFSIDSIGEMNDYIRFPSK
ncbi:MAG: radical SAM protein, partial [Bdellovibrionales bacterium]|nr:radical SAM protein [Bdellovibrionales bacterium]